MNVSAVADIAGNTDRPERQATRLAELVLHLTDCSADDALRAVSDPPMVSRLDNDATLARVATAIVSLRR